MRHRFRFALLESFSDVANARVCLAAAVPTASVADFDFAPPGRDLFAMRQVSQTLDLHLCALASARFFLALILQSERLVKAGSPPGPREGGRAAPEAQLGVKSSRLAAGARESARRLQFLCGSAYKSSCHTDPIFIRTLGTAYRSCLPRPSRMASDAAYAGGRGRTDWRGRLYQRQETDR